MYELPTDQYGMYLEVAVPESAVAHRETKRAVLTAFRQFVQQIRAEWNLARVRDFQFIVCPVRLEPIFDGGEVYQWEPTYGWKCRVHFAKTI